MCIGYLLYYRVTPVEFIAAWVTAPHGIDTPLPSQNSLGPVFQSVLKVKIFVFIAHHRLYQGDTYHEPLPFFFFSTMVQMESDQAVRTALQAPGPVPVHHMDNAFFC